MLEYNAEVIVCANLNDLSEKAAGAFVKIARQTIEEEGIFTVALAGGSTPKSLYELLASDEYRELVDWGRVHIFWGDERSVPPSHPDSNYRMAEKALLSKINIPGKNIHRIKGELGSDGACEYEKELCNFFRALGNRPPQFDLVLLGIGADGHTASIFPHTPAVTDADLSVTAAYVEKLESTRITLTSSAINASANIFFLVSGEEKAVALREVLEGDYDPEEWPAQLTRKSEGSIIWFVDEGAASMLTGR